MKTCQRKIKERIVKICIDQSSETVSIDDDRRGNGATMSSTLSRCKRLVNSIHSINGAESNLLPWSASPSCSSEQPPHNLLVSSSFNLCPWWLLASIFSASISIQSHRGLFTLLSANPDTRSLIYSFVYLYNNPNSSKSDFREN